MNFEDNFDVENGVLFLVKRKNRGMFAIRFLAFLFFLYNKTGPKNQEKSQRNGVNLSVLQFLVLRDIAH